MDKEPVAESEMGRWNGAGLAIGAGRHVLRALLDFALPPRCPACGQIVAEPHAFGLGCWQSLSWLGEPCCARCGLPFEYGSPGEDVECGACLADPPRFARLRSAVAYGDTARKVALKLKYGGRPSVAETLARFMARQIGRPERTDSALLVPVPLHRWRIWTRGYNQAALIATALSKRTAIPAELAGRALLRALRASLRIWQPERGAGMRRLPG